MPDLDDPDATVAALIAAGRDREAAQRGAAGLAAGTGGPMDPLTQFDELGPVLMPVLAGIREGDLSRPTACDALDVRGVLEHMVGGATTFVAAYRGEEPTTPDLHDPLGAIGPTLGGLGEALHAPGALDRTIEAPFGAVSGDQFARFIVLDGLVHGWDLATATGQPYDPPAELVAAVDEFARVALDPLRDGDTFAAAVSPAPDASPLERLVAYTGRQP